jgi:hypothetical protein
MAITDTKKVDYLWKKIGYGVTKTDTNANKKAPNEAIASPLLLNGANTWNRADQIPGVQPGSSTGVVTVYPTSGPDACTVDNTTGEANRTWKTGLIDWIPPEFGSTYQAKVYIHTAGDAVNAAASGTQVFATGSGNNDEWFFDYQSGVLHFIGANLPNGVDFTGKVVYIAASRYTGAKGLESIYTYVDSQVSATNTLTIADDGSTTSAINLDNTIQFLGSTGITTSVSGDTLTITGPNLSSYITASSADALSNKTGNISQWTNDSAYATTTYVGTQITNLIASAPGALDTLNELAAALGDDADFATTVTNSLALKVAKTDTGLIVVGDDSTGTAITVGETFKVAGATGITTAVSGDTLTITGPDLTSFATTSYVDAQNIAQSLTFVGDDSSGTLVSSGETFKVAGATGITTAVSGDTLTITGPDLSSYLTAETNDLSSAVTWANVPDANITEGSVTQHQGALSITESQISDLGTYITSSSLDTLTNKTFDANGTGNSISNIEVADFAGSAVITVSETLSANDSDSALVTAGAIIDYVDAQDANIASDTLTFTNKTFDANATGNSISNIEVADFAAGVLDTDLSSVAVTDTTIASAKAIKAYVDAQITSSNSLTVGGDDSSEATIDLDNTLNVKGAGGISTSATGDTLTITGPDLSSYATTTYVGTQIANLVDSSPEALNTLNELAAALGDDANFSTTITNSLANKVAKTDTGLIVVGDDSTGTAITVGETFKVAGATGITTAVSGDTLTITGPDLSSYATTSYVDAQNVAQSLTFVGDDSSGTLVSSGETFKIAGAGGITTSVSGDTLTISSSGGTGSNPVSTQFDFNKLTTTQAVVDEFDKGEARGCFYHVSIEDKTSNTTGHYRINLVHNDTDVDISVFDLVEDSSTMVAFTAAISGNNIQLSAQSVSSEHVNLRFNKFILHDGLETTASTNTAVAVSTVSADSSTHTLDSFTASDYDAVKYYVVTKDSTNSIYEVSEVLLTQYNSSVNTSVVARVTTGGGPKLMTVSSSVSSGTITLSGTSNSSANLSVIVYAIRLGDKTKFGQFDGITYGKVTDIDSSEVIIDEFDSLKQSAAKYIVRVGSGSDIQLFEISITGDSDTSSIVTTYLDKVDNLMTFSTDVNGNKVRLKGSGTGFNNDLTFARVDFLNPNLIYTASNSDEVHVNSKSSIVLPQGNTAARPSAKKGLIRFNTQTGKYEVSEDGSTYLNLRTASSTTITKDVFTGDGSSTSFTMTITPTDENTIVLYIDGVMQEPGENYTISGTTLTISEAVHNNGRIVIMHGFAN